MTLSDSPLKIREDSAEAQRCRSRSSRRSARCAVAGLGSLQAAGARREGSRRGARNLQQDRLASRSAAAGDLWPAADRRPEQRRRSCAGRGDPALDRQALSRPAHRRARQERHPCLPRRHRPPRPQGRSGVPAQRRQSRRPRHLVGNGATHHHRGAARQPHRQPAADDLLQRDAVRPLPEAGVASRLRPARTSHRDRPRRRQRQPGQDAVPALASNHHAGFRAVAAQGGLHAGAKCRRMPARS